MPKQIFRILDDLSPAEVHLRNLPRKPDGLYNMKFNEYGQLEKRTGYAKYNTDSLSASKKILGMHRFYKQDTSSKYFLVACDTSIYTLTDSSGHAGTAIKTGLTTGKETFFTDFYNHNYFVNGTDGVFKYNGTNVRTVNMTVPTAPTGSAEGSGSLTAGDYYYKITYVDEDGYESNGGTASEAITSSGSDTIVLTIPTSSDAKVVYRNIYRTTADGVVYYYEGQVADNTTTEYTSTTADTTICLNTVLHTDHDAPSSTSHLITKRLSRLCIADGEKLYISQLSDCEYFPDTWYIQTGNMQKIMGIMEQKYTLPVLTDDSLERLLYTDEDNFEFENSYSTQGCIASRSLANCENLLVYLGFEGIYYFDGVDVKQLNDYLNKYIRDNINESYAYLSAGVYYDFKYILSYPKGESTVPNETIYYDFRYQTYGVYSFSFGCFSKWDKGSDGLSLKGGSTTIGRVYDVFSGTNDDGSSITCYDAPEPIDLGVPELYKQWYDIYIKVKSTTGTALTMYYTLDNASETSASLTMTADTTKWYRIPLEGGGQRARAIKIRPYVSDAYAVTIMGYMLTYDLEAPEYA